MSKRRLHTLPIVTKEDPSLSKKLKKNSLRITPGFKPEKQPEIPKHVIGVRKLPQRVKWLDANHTFYIPKEESPWIKKIRGFFWPKDP